jgi:hypothetical protein
MKKPATHLPKAFSFEIGGYGGVAHEVKFEKGLLWHRRMEDFVLRAETGLSLSATDWQRFWEAIEQAGVWKWETYYSTMVCDGTQWSLKIRHGGRKLDSGGSNCYPGGNEDEYDEASPFPVLSVSIRVHPW